MASFVIVALFLSGLLLILSSSSVLLLLWNNARQDVYLYFSFQIVTVIVWLFGSSFARTFEQAFWMIELGFGGAAIATYLLAARLSEIYSASTRATVFVAIFFIIMFRLIISSLFGVQNNFQLTESGLLNYQFSTIDTYLYLVIILATLWITRQNIRKINSNILANGLTFFAIGQLSALLLSQLRVFAVSEIITAFSAFLIGYAFLQRDIMTPLLGRTRQLEVMRDVGLAMTSEVPQGDVLNNIAKQAAELFEADGSAIYLKRSNELVLEAVDTIPKAFLGYSLPLGEGFAGMVAEIGQSRLIPNYRREWKGIPDMPLALDSFGAVIGVPLIFREEVVGVLLVINGWTNEPFSDDDMQLMSLIAPQAAVAISNSFLFEQERALKDEVTSAKQQLEAFLTSTENPVIAIDRNLSILFANPAAAGLLGVPQAELQNKPLLTTIQPQLLPNPRQLLRDIHRSNSHVYEVEIKEQFYLCHIARLVAPIEGWVAVLNNVTRLKEIDRLKSQMVRMTSHDLKNPLFSIMTYMELLEEDGAPVFDKDMTHYVQAIWKQLTRMERIIKGILDLEKVQSGAPPMSPTDLRKLLESCAHSIEDQAHSRRIAFEADIEDGLHDVLADASQLEQVVSNLLDNALKYTPAGGSIWLRAHNLEDAVIVEVEDTGHGIPREVQNQVFDRFFRVKSTQTETVGGSGIGLSLVKAIIDHHKGRVWLKSEIGVGTSFYVTLPALREPVKI
ncbi:MAG: ATP-binding protein [Chloroflexi bacterium]|nr:ATP-binding protein [Chloroflexota bacterium]